MIIGGPTTRILGLVALIAAGGCGSESGRPTIPPLDSSAALVPATVPPAAPPARFPEALPSAAPLLGPGELSMVGRLPPLDTRPTFKALRAPAVATGDPELDPLVSYLKASFARAIKDGHPLVIDDKTSVDLLDSRERLQDLVDGWLREASDRVPAEMIRDFGEKNRKSRAVWPELTRHLPAVLLTLEEKKAFFSDSDGWKRFYAKYPGSPGIITVSRVGLNRDKTLAIFYMGNQRHWLNGMGQLHVLKKEGDVWVELPVQIGSSWIS